MQKRVKPTAVEQQNPQVIAVLQKVARQILSDFGVARHDRLYVIIKGAPQSLSLLDDEISLAVAGENRQRYSLCSQIKVLFSKNEGLSSASCEAVAIASFYKAEKLCARANRRIALTSRGRIGLKYWPVLERARRIIHATIGDRPILWTELGKHGNGAAIGCGGEFTASVFKDASLPYAVSRSCAGHFAYLVETSPIWHDIVDPHPRQPTPGYLTLVDSTNRFTTVPKNWKTHRGICVEPLGNVYVQQALGREIAEKLKRVGINIFKGVGSGQEKHRELARVASLMEGVYGNDPVTIDLSMASDTVCRELVRMLLPEMWYHALDCARCHSTTMPDGTVVRTSKFSSMGNAATFPLETLIFWALSSSVVAETCHTGVVSAFGDDIIVPRGAALLLSEVFRWCGFVINSDKSFIHGVFYESCGADYFGGVSVRPFYIKRPMLSILDYCFVHNAAAVDAYVAFPSTLCESLRKLAFLNCEDKMLFGPAMDFDKHGVQQAWFYDDRPELWVTRVKGWRRSVKGYKMDTFSVPLQDSPSLLGSLRGGGGVGRIVGKVVRLPTTDIGPRYSSVVRYLDMSGRRAGYAKRWIHTV